MGKKWFTSVRLTLQGEHWRKGLDERLSEAVGVGTLTGDHQDVARLDSIAEITVSPDIVRGTEGPEDEAVSLREGRVGEIDYREIICFEPLPADNIRTAVDNDQIFRLLVHYGQEYVHRIVDQPTARLSENLAVDMREDMLAQGLPNLAGKNL